MDHFEQELARLMRDSEEHTPYEDRHRDRLQAGVRARRRNRTVWMATGSAVTLTGLGVVLVLMTGPFAQGGPAGPGPRPVTSAESVLMPSTTAPPPLPLPLPANGKPTS
ncbi:hypothetical protein [Streptomyces sp. S.PB5]|uniref:hypothetical protein n=1 Tax=Streptomyces sp. S.PB5 TaxID=3020844 RepID=UPI0025B019F9|nr:hypothetical protein [Streptomyces sp. S.PB5]MDN3027313.1 hypothetical protein [Streptomyces sp. S.PB5]